MIWNENITLENDFWKYTEKIPSLQSNSIVKLTNQTVALELIYTIIGTKLPFMTLTSIISMVFVNKMRCTCINENDTFSAEKNNSKWKKLFFVDTCDTPRKEAIITAWNKQCVHSFSNLIYKQYLNWMYPISQQLNSIGYFNTLYKTKCD